MRRALETIAFHAIALALVAPPVRNLGSTAWQKVQVRSDEKIGFVRDGLTSLETVHVEPIDYPSSARGLGLEGTVSLRIIVAVDGSVKSVRVAYPSPRLVDFETEAVRATKRAIYKPILFNGLPVEVAFDRRVSFTLKDEKPAVVDTKPLVHIDAGHQAPKLIGSPALDIQENAPTGQLIAEMTVNELGAVANLVVLKHIDEATDKRIVTGLKQWSFEPARINGAAARIVFVVSVTIR